MPRYHPRVTVRCPFCGAEAPEAALPARPDFPRRTMAYRLRCDSCHRAYLLVVRVTLGLFRSFATHIL